MGFYSCIIIERRRRPRVPHLLRDCRETSLVRYYRHSDVGRTSQCHISGSGSNGARTEFNAELVREENEVEADAEAQGVLLWAYCGSGSRLETRRFDTGERERE